MVKPYIIRIRKRPNDSGNAAEMESMKMNCSKMSIDQLREVVAWVDDRAAYRRACGTVSGTSYAEDESAARAALAEISRREYRAKEAEFMSAPALCEHDPNKQPTV